MEDKIPKVIDQATKQKYNQVYYLKHKERLSQRIVCECGLSYSKSNKTIHCEGRVHKLWDKMKKEAEIKN